MDEEGDAGADDRGDAVGLSSLDGLVKIVLASRCLASRFSFAALWATLVCNWRKLKEFRAVMLLLW